MAAPFTSAQIVEHYQRNLAQLHQRYGVNAASNVDVLLTSASSPPRPQVGIKVPRPRPFTAENLPAGFAPRDNLDRPLARKMPPFLRGPPTPARKMPVQPKKRYPSSSDSDSSSSSGSDSESDSYSVPTKRNRKRVVKTIRVAKNCMPVDSPLDKLYPHDLQASRQYGLAPRSTSREVRVDTQFAIPFHWYRKLNINDLYTEHFGLDGTLPESAQRQIDQLVQSFPLTFRDPKFLGMTTTLERRAVAFRSDQDDAYYVDDRALGCLFKGVTESQRNQAYIAAEESLFQLLTDTTEAHRATILKHVVVELNKFLITYLTHDWSKDPDRKRQTEYLKLGRPHNKVAGGIGCPVLVHRAGTVHSLDIKIRQGLCWERGDPLVAARTVVEVRLGEDQMNAPQEAFMFLLHHAEVWGTMLQSARIAQFFIGAKVKRTELATAIQLVRHPETILNSLYKPNKEFYHAMEIRLGKWVDAMKTRASFEWSDKTDLTKQLSLELAKSFDRAAKTSARKMRGVSEANESDSSSGGSSKSSIDSNRSKRRLSVKPNSMALAVPVALYDSSSDSEARELRNQLRVYDANGKQNMTVNRELAGLSREELRARVSSCLEIEQTVVVAEQPTGGVGVLSEQPATEPAQSPVVESEQPAMVAESEQPAKPVMVESEQPAMVESEQPAMVESAQSPVVESEQPALVESAQSPVVESEQPAMVESEQPAMVESAQSPVVESEQPAMLESAQSPVVESEQPAMVESEQPAMVESEQPANPAMIELEQLSKPTIVQSEQPAKRVTVESEQPVMVELEQPANPAMMELEQPSKPTIVESEQPAKRVTVQSEQPAMVESEQPAMVESFGRVNPKESLIQSIIGPRRKMTSIAAQRLQKLTVQELQDKATRAMAAREAKAAKQVWTPTDRMTRSRTKSQTEGTQ